MSNRVQTRAIRGWVFPVVSLALYGLLCAFFYRSIVAQNGGTFTYVLDDTYIHLALSDSIAHGTYGINLNEVTSPSSSLLWPLLLAPFARLSWFVYAPLLLNLIFGGLASWLFGTFVEDLRGDDAATGETFRRLLSALALVMIGNLPALTCIGMEHSLQVLLAGACAWGVVACLRGQRVPWWCIAAALIGPSVRYEALDITLALALALWGQRRRSAALSLALSVVPLALFARFLRHHGLPSLPLSVMIKGHAIWAHYNPGGFVAVHFTDLIDNFHYMPIVWLVSLLFVILVIAAVAEKQTARRYALVGSAAAVGLHILFGRFGWNDRYEVYIFVFGVLVLLQLEWERPHGSLAWYTVGLLGLSLLYIQGTTSVGWSAHSIYLQQLQTSRFLHSLPTTNVAVNDLGLVSFHHPKTQYVLDLFGLASMEAASEPHTTGWMGEIVQRHHVGVVAIYPSWFPSVPASWTEIGELCRPTGVDNCVAYFATDEKTKPWLREQFRAFTRTVPAELLVKLPPAAPVGR